MTLTQDEFKGLKAALIDTFRTKPKLQQFVKEQLGKNLDEIALGDDLGELVFKLMEYAESRGEEAKLIFVARESNPYNPKLAAFVRVYEVEYWRQLEQKANCYEPEEVYASNAIIEVQAEVIRVIESQPNVNDELSQLLLKILDKLNQQELPAAVKLKAVLPIIPFILDCEVELDIEKSLQRLFQPIKRLWEKTIDEGK